jgi:predicted phage terminase large subunit-like protein
MKTQSTLTTISPQPGPQTAFASTSADIAIYGGAAGGGKTFSLLLEPLRHVKNKDFQCVFFRRETPQITNEGALWDEAGKLYPLFGAKPRLKNLRYKFPSGMTCRFTHLEAEDTVLNFQGSQIPLMLFDELTHFTRKQFFYMLSRNRSTSGVNGYIRASCNPDPDSWVANFISWWIGEDGYPIADRSGKIRWFVAQGDSIFWADSKEELIDKYGPDSDPISVTFIPSKIYDNKIFLEKDPKYLSKLKNMSRVDRGRLLDGNWKIKPSAGMFFQKGYFEVLNEIPGGWNKIIRYWDRAATKPSESNPDPDWTAGLLMYHYPNGTCVIADVRRMRDTPLMVEEFVKNTASQDPQDTRICVEQDPGSAGVSDADNYVRLLRGYDIRVRKNSKDKATRAKPVSAQAERGNVKVLGGSWNDAFFEEVENFQGDGKGHDDQVDCLSGAYNEINESVTLFDMM